MENKFLNSRIQHKIDTAENWAKATNFKPLDGEIIVYSDLRKIKIGNGEDFVNDLDFYYDYPIEAGEGENSLQFLVS